MKLGLNKLYLEKICKKNDNSKLDLNGAKSFIEAEPY